jgi:hypothetical protein
VALALLRVYSRSTFQTILLLEYTLQYTLWFGCSCTPLGATLFSDAEGDASSYLTQNNTVDGRMPHWSTHQSTRQRVATLSFLHGGGSLQSSRQCAFGPPSSVLLHCDEWGLRYFFTPMPRRTSAGLLSEGASGSIGPTYRPSGVCLPVKPSLS